MSAYTPLPPTRAVAERRPLVPAALVLALGLLLSSLVLGVAFYQARRPVGEIRVVGAATVPFQSDVVKWRLALTRTSDEAGLTTALGLVRADLDGVVRRLREAGVPESAISMQPIGSNAMWGPNGMAGHQVRQGLLVISSDVDQVERIALDPSGLLEPGAVLEGSTLEFFYADLPELKRSLLAEATGDAAARAREIAERAGVELGRMTSARAGVFQITEPYSTEVSGYGMYSTSTRAKEITVTVHATFETR